MLEVKHLKRIYKTKNGNSVHALNDVSLKFPETGLIFILGKSGSGKSTLLNIIGGLDKPDEGEIIIDGKSSKNFSDSELDSYRNTYLGFIFQEYNILPDFSVKENISIALQLQNKKADDETIDNILEEVDLKGLGKRKPDELSGGQKQRVAIARALVKNPSIILADEPTGALDSNTGKQVFETLKKLAVTKLVIVVSHDRDFAEHFGDRVIEIKDGQIISDISKSSTESVTPYDGIYLLSDNIIRINKDHLLTEKDLPFINKAISNSNGDVYFIGDNKVNESLKQAAKINENGNKVEFKDTNEDEIVSVNKEFKSIKSKYSLLQAFKMGAKSLRIKPFRLVMTIILSVISFSLFGASITLSLFSKPNAVKSTILKNNMDYLYTYIYENNTSYGYTTSRINEIESHGAKVYPFANNIDEITINTNFPKTTEYFHTSKWKEAITVTPTILNDFNITLAFGELPTYNNECAISLYTYYTFADYGMYTSNDKKTFINPEDITPEKVIGTYIDTSKYTSTSSSTQQTQKGITKYKITGIIDTKINQNLLKYRTEKPIINNILDSDAISELSKLKDHNYIHNKLFIGSQIADLGTYDVTYKYVIKDDNYHLLDSSQIKYNYLFDKTKTELEDQQAIISIYNLQYILANDSTISPNSDFIEKFRMLVSKRSQILDTYVENNYQELYEKYFAKEGSEETDTVKKQRIASFITTSKFTYYDEYPSLQAELKDGAISILDTISIYPDVNLDGKLAIKQNDPNDPNKQVTLKIGGVYLDDISTQSTSNDIYISKNYAKTLINLLNENGTYDAINSKNTSALIVFNKNKLDDFLSYFYQKESVYESAKDEAIKGSFMLSFPDNKIFFVQNVSEIIIILTAIFVYVGLVLGIFSMLLFYSFMSISINNKKREIGILRAVGAKRIDVFKIFYSEAFIIATINFILSTIIVFIVSYIINAKLATTDVFTFDLMTPNYIVVLLLFIISILSSFLSSLLPVIKIASKKPIDAIQNR